MSSRSHSLIVSPRANRDIDAILLHSLETWGERQKDAYKAALDRALRELVDFPEMGRSRDDLGPGVRSRRVEQHVIFYRVDTGSIRVLRILHGRREVRRELLE